MDQFLPGVPAPYILDRLARSKGNEIQSGKFDSPESSAALAANAFGWFVERPTLVPPIPGVKTGPAKVVELEFNARFPWQGGTHPWLDAAIFTETHLIGVESKRFEPFRDRKTVNFTEVYDRQDWGAAMARYDQTRRHLVSGALAYRHLDAAQLAKHAYGLITEAKRYGLLPVMFYVFAEPNLRGELAILPDDHRRHRDEIDDFAVRVAGDEVSFSSASYREWLASAHGDLAIHGDRLVHRFQI